MPQFCYESAVMDPYFRRMSMLRSFKVLAPKFPVALTAATRNLSRGVVRNKGKLIFRRGN